MLPREYKIIRACNLYNKLTNPSALLTDFEHRIARKAAKNVRSYMRRHFRESVDFKEWSNGALFPCS